MYSTVHAHETLSIQNGIHLIKTESYLIVTVGLTKSGDVSKKMFWFTARTHKTYFVFIQSPSIFVLKCSTSIDIDMNRVLCCSRSDQPICYCFGLSSESVQKLCALSCVYWQIFLDFVVVVQFGWASVCVCERVLVLVCDFKEKHEWWFHCADRERSMISYYTSYHRNQHQCKMN